MVILCLILVLAMSGCGGGNDTAEPAPGDQTGETNEQIIVMKLANANPPGDIRDQVSQKFAELVEEKTNGRVKVEVYSGGTLGDWRDTLEGLGIGVNEIVIESIGTLDAWAPLANIDPVPYVFRDYDHFIKVFYGPVGREIMDEVGKQGGFKMFGPMYRGARVVTSKKPFEHVDEARGLKIRAPNIQMYIKTWQALGASPTPLAITETFTALQQGTVDAQENPVVECYGHGFYDVCDYLILTNHVYGADVFVFNEQYFASLQDDIQTAIEEAALEAAEWRNNVAVEMEKEYVEKFKEKGVTVIEPDVESFRNKLDGFIEREFPDLVPWVDKIKAVQ